MSDSPVLTEAYRQFLGETHFAVLAALDPDGAPRQAVIWYRLGEGDTIVVNSAIGRRWPTNLRRSARLSLAVLDAADGYRWLGLTGFVDAVVDDQEVAQADIAEMARRYRADDPATARADIARFERQRRVTFRITITATHDHLRD